MLCGMRAGSLWLMVLIVTKRKNIGISRNMNGREEGLDK